MALTPILLPDPDGLRLTRTGKIGQYRMEQFHNPQLLGEILGERHKRDLIRNTNQKKWS